MFYTIAIQPDDYTNRRNPDKYDASSPRWAELIKKAGHRVKWVDVRRPDILEQLKGCHGFMWRWAHFGGMGRIARRLLPVVEKELGLVVYPDQNTCWYYDDKIAQTYLFQALNIPTPKTWVWFDRDEAKKWAEGADYPAVLKLSSGAGSSNVRLIKNLQEALYWIDRMFISRMTSLSAAEHKLNLKQRIRKAGSVLIRGRIPELIDNGYELQSGYVLFQEYLPGNSYDTRVIVIGDRCFAKRRYNRENDFRASGSGKLNVNPANIDKYFLRLAFSTAKAIESKSCAIDGLYAKDRTGVVSEVSYTYPSWGVHACPSHWRLDGEPETGRLNWVEGKMWPEEAQIEDYLKQLDIKYNNRES